VTELFKQIKVAPFLAHPVYTRMNLSSVKWAECDKTQCRELLGMFMCVCTALCTIVAHSIAQKRRDNFPSCLPDNYHCSDDVYLREGGWRSSKTDYSGYSKTDQQLRTV